MNTTFLRRAVAASAVMACLSTAPAALATTLVNYDFQEWVPAPNPSSPSYVNSAVSASDFAFVGGHYTNSYWSPNTAGPSANFSITALRNVYLNTLSFAEFNNDCENGGNIFYSSGCGASFAVKELIDGGAAATIGSFGAGEPYIPHLVSEALGLPLAVGETASFSIVTETDPAVYTAIYQFENVTVSGAVPEPSTWTMMLLGFAGLGFAGYRRARAGHATLAA